MAEGRGPRGLGQSASCVVFSPDVGCSPWGRLIHQALAGWDAGREEQVGRRADNGPSPRPRGGRSSGGGGFGSRYGRPPRRTCRFRTPPHTAFAPGTAGPPPVPTALAKSRPGVRGGQRARNCGSFHPALPPVASRAAASSRSTWSRAARPRCRRRQAPPLGLRPAPGAANSDSSITPTPARMDRLGRPVCGMVTPGRRWRRSPHQRRAEHVRWGSFGLVAGHGGRARLGRIATPGRRSIGRCPGTRRLVQRQPGEELQLTSLADRVVTASRPSCRASRSSAYRRRRGRQVGAPAAARRLSDPPRARAFPPMRVARAAAA